MSGSAITESDGPQATEAVAAELAASLVAGDVVLLAGELGAGKTTFVRGACRALGVTARVTSPTFTVGQRYAARDGLRVAHLDLYRLTALDDEDPELLTDYLGADTIAFVEWPRDLEAFLPVGARVAARVQLEHAGGDRRRITVARTQ